MARQPGTGQWDTGVSKWQSETLGFSLLAVLVPALHLEVCFVCTVFVSFNLFSFLSCRVS